MAACMPPPPVATSPISKRASLLPKTRKRSTHRRRTPLHVAVYLKQHDAARALIRLGADPNKLDIDRYDIITIAAVANDVPDASRSRLKAAANPKAVTSRYNGNGP